MALKSFNVAKGLSVGAVATDVIDQNANITAAGLSANGNVSFTSNVTLTGANVSLGNVANLHITGGSNGQVLTTDGNGTLTFSTAAASYGNSQVEALLSSGTVNGIVATYFSGDGANLTNINGANVSEVANATYATTAGSADSVAGADVSGEVSFAATANSVAGANVSGAVANATYATSAGSADSVNGADVSGEVAYANIANNVSGSNVSGAVANATYATTAGSADSVSGANVSGEVANAGYATYSGTAYSVSGANVSGEVANAGYATYAGTAYDVSGANVSGEVANAAFATNANVAYYLQGQLANTLLTNGYGIAGGAFDYSQIQVGAGGGGQALNLKALDSNLTIQTGSGGSPAHTWTFTQSGNIVLPANTFAINYANGDQVTIGNASYAANAGYANFAGEAYSVSGSNVSGEVANAAYATNSGSASYASTAGYADGVDGANVSGAVSAASTAYSVDGANVVGAVSAASTAYSVDGANVSGTVSNATTAGTANSVDGANVSGTVAYAQTAYSVDGGNVSGTVANATYAANAGFADSAGYVTNSDQSNITQVGTLANLTTNGFANIGGTLTVTTGGANITGDIEVTGNMTIGGNLTYIGVQDLTISDPIIFLGANNASDIFDLGFNAQYTNGSLLNTGLARDHVDGVWKFYNTSTQPTTTVDFGTLASMAAQTITASADIGADGNINADGYISAVGSVSGGSLSTQGTLEIGSTITYAFYTLTTSTSAVSLGKIAVSPGQALQFLLRGADQAAPKYSTASAMVLTDGTGNVDYSLYGVLDMGGGAGTFTFASADAGANVEVFVTASSSNSTYWSTQATSV